MKKMKKMVLGLMAVLMCCAVLATGCNQSTEPVEGEEVALNEEGKKAILVVSFGTSYADTRAVTIEAIEEKIAAAYPDYDVVRAFTSNIIIKVMKDRDGIEVMTPEEALAALDAEGYSEVIVQPTHVMAGAEYNDVRDLVMSYNGTGAFDNIVLGQALLQHTESYDTLIEGLQSNQLPEGEAVVFMGHGTHHAANATYPMLRSKLIDHGLDNVYVGTVEGYPTLDDVIEELNADNITEVTLMPFMIVAGDHANNDMAGDEEDSWKTMLKKEGFTVNIYLHGLGENEAVQDMYVENVAKAIAGENMLEN